MKDKKSYPPRISLILRALVALYLLYTAWELREAPGHYEGGQRLLFLLAIAVFTVVGLALGGFSIKALLKGEYEKPEE